MAFTLTSPITGATMSGLTSPTYTHGVDVAPTLAGKQVAVTALGGTQTGVNAHSVASPFTLTFVRPASFKPLTVSAAGEVMRSNAKNIWKFLTRKGMIPAAGTTLYEVGTIETIVTIPVGAETADPKTVQAMMSAHIGALSQQSSGFGDSTTSGIS